MMEYAEHTWTIGNNVSRSVALCNYIPNGIKSTDRQWRTKD